MAATCPAGFDTKRLREEVSAIYGRVATEPTGDYHFHRGPQYASDFLGYDAAELKALPAESTACFVGVGNPLAIADVEPGQVVLDIGCGAGMDLLLAAKRVGATGRAIGVDMTETMRQRSLAAARAAGLAERVEVRDGDAEDLPIDDSSVDVVISNGVLNLTTDKQRAFSEIWRVLRPGGRLLLADIVVHSELSEGIRGDIELWTGWIAGALPEAELVQLLGQAGLSDCRIDASFDCFRGTTKEGVARQFGVRGVNLFARKA